MSGRILVAEDDARMREIVEDYFTEAGYTVLTASDGAEAIRVFEREAVDVVLLDVMMPHLDGWSVCRRIRQRSDVLIVMLSARSEDDDRLMGFELGADEYVTKPFSPKVLVAGVTALLKRSGGKVMRDELLRAGDIALDRQRYRVTVGSEAVSLTTRELELLALLMQHPGRVFRRDDLILSLWGYDYCGDGRVVDTNIKTLRKKLGGSGKHIQTVIGIGYRFEVSA